MRTILGVILLTIPLTGCATNGAHRHGCPHCGHHHHAHTPATPQAFPQPALPTPVQPVQPTTPATAVSARLSEGRIRVQPAVDRQSDRPTDSFLPPLAPPAETP